MAQVFYRKWRPQNLTGVVGQEQITQTLLNALKNERVSHAYLFCGPRGTGKTSTGRILAKAVNCLNNGKGEPCNTCSMCLSMNEGSAIDVIEIDAASNTGVDDIRDLREKVNYAPNQARYKVYIIDEAHMLSTNASNALLKTLEEPPPHVIFILATTESHKVLSTIQSRCQRFDFRRLSQDDIVNKLANICKAEKINIEPPALQLIAKSATGSLRDAENTLQQLATYYGSEIGLHQVQSVLGITGDWRAKELVKDIINNDISAGIATINSVNSDGLDLRQFNRELIEYLRGMLLVKTGSAESVDFTTEDLSELKKLVAKSSLPQILKAVKLFGQLDFSFDNYSTLPLELALVDSILTSEEEVVATPAQAETKPHPPVKEHTQPVEVQRKAAKEESAPPEIRQRSTEAERTQPEPKQASPKAKPVAKVQKPADVEHEPSVPSPKPPVTETTTQPAQTNSEIDRLKLEWRKVTVLAPDDVKKTLAIAILRSAGVYPVAIEDDTVILAFRHKIHLEQIEKTENKEVTQRIISHFLGSTYSVRCIHEPENNHLLKAALNVGAQIINTEEK
jgi:DNA polymerase-3 subunit gamma/tau